MSDDALKITHKIYYNIFRFESLIRAICNYPAYLLFHKPLISDISETQDENDVIRRYLSSVLRGRKGYGATRLVAMTELALLVIPWNIFCAVFGVHSINMWICGWAVASVVAIIISFKADDPKKYLKDFKKFELRSQQRLRRSALMAFLTMIGIWSICILSFIYFIQNSIRHSSQ